jgi:hypothetical protein
MDKKRLGAIFLGLILMLSIVIFLDTQDNSSTVLTGKVTEGSSCTTQRATNCIGENVAICINGEWKNAGPVPGECGYEDFSDPPNNYNNFSDPPNNYNNFSDDEDEKNTWIWIIIIVIVLLILGVIGFVIYTIIQKDNKKRNTSSKKFDPKNNSFSSKPNPLSPQSRTMPMKSSLPPMRPSNIPQNSSNSPQNKGVKRYTPPKR